MEAATFYANHKESNSRALVEFGLRDKKVSLVGIYFIRGNTIDINVVRSLHTAARRILLSR